MVRHGTASRRKEPINWVGACRFPVYPGAGPQPKGPCDGFPAHRRPADDARRHPHLRREAARPPAPRRPSTGAKPTPRSCEELGEMGFCGIGTPAEYGGAALDAITYALIISELSWADASVGVAVSVTNSLVPGPDHAPRHRGAEAPLPARPGQRQEVGRLRPDRARGRHRRRRHQDRGRARRRPLRPQRQQVLRHQRRLRRHRGRLRQHRPLGEAQGHLAPSWSRRTRPASPSARRKTSSASGRRPPPS